MRGASLDDHRLVADVNSIGALRPGAANGDPGAVREAALQFEALFMRELIKSMRQATMRSGLLDSAGENLATDLLDQQLSRSLAGQPGGLSELLVRQLTQQAATASGGGMTSATGAGRVSAGAPAASGAVRPASRVGQSAFAETGGNVGTFVRRLGPAAEAIGRSTGIPAAFMLGQAGHETGWGSKEIRHPDGTPSHNVFGIKASSAWKGPVVEVTTTEYVDGEPRKTRAAFRAYGSYREAFEDYARLIQASPRYAEARARLDSPREFAFSLQRAGYATDPRYGEKVARAIEMAARMRPAVG